MSGFDGPTKNFDRCEAPVRWRNGVLQQLWRITTVTNGNGSFGLTLSCREEWRDVPIVAPGEDLMGSDGNAS